MVLPHKRNGHQTEWALELASSKALLNDVSGSVLRSGATGMNWIEPALCSLGLYSLVGAGRQQTWKPK